MPVLSEAVVLFPLWLLAAVGSDCSTLPRLASRIRPRGPHYKPTAHFLSSAYVPLRLHIQLFHIRHCSRSCLRAPSVRSSRRPRLSPASRRPIMGHHGPLLPDSVSEPGANLQRDPAATARHVSGSEVITEADGVLKSTDAPADAQAPCESTIHARAYQLEMLDKSLGGNIIVAMDTGSGKTQVAVYRIRHEIERSPAKVVWFLVPTVTLCHQQFNVLQSQIPSVQIKMLTGEDNVDAWSSPSVWDAFLENVAVVVSTYQILYEALGHAFISMDRLSLLVFDEAHNCTRNHPGAKIMQRYHERKAAQLSVPSILGLTASPIMSASGGDLEKLEETLDAICRSPSRHREELLAYMKPPELICVKYDDADAATASYAPTASMEKLGRLYWYLDENIHQDPYVRWKKDDNTERSRQDLETALKKRKTYTLQQVKSLYGKSEEICRELGSYAADYYIAKSIGHFDSAVEKNGLMTLSRQYMEKHYLATKLRDLGIQLPAPDAITVSPKAKALLETLASLGDDTLGIIFAKQTATVNVLGHILSVHPLTRHRFRYGTMVGISRTATRSSDLGELDRRLGSSGLEKFREGKLDILVATSVLEEGVDVPACNLVICFDQPADLKSFIQRRGRARMRDSKLLLFQRDDPNLIRDWNQLEEDMKQQYSDDLRVVQEIGKLESIQENTVPPIYDETTGAKLEAYQARAHLDHFCSAIASHQYVDASPYYLTETIPGHEKEAPRIAATVVLPISLPANVRRIKSAQSWCSEKRAYEDAALQACRLLHREGLLNNHFMPFKDHELIETLGSRRASVIEVNERWNPWPGIARAWSEGKLYQRRLRMRDHVLEVVSDFNVSLPVPFPRVSDFKVYWDANPWTVEFGDLTRATTVSHDETAALIALAHGHRLRRAVGQYVVGFESNQGPISMEQLGGQMFPQELRTGRSDEFPFLVRTGDQSGPFFYQDWLPSRPSYDLFRNMSSYTLGRYNLGEEADQEPWLALKRWPRRRDFLHPMDAPQPKPLTMPDKPSGEAWPLSLCRVDSTPISNVLFGSMVPSITHMLEIYLVTHELCRTVLHALEISNLSRVVTAISSPEAREATRYEQYEFMGDSLLKFLATINVMAHHPTFPEGYLSKKKDGIVSNTRLLRSAVETGLDRFILVKPFTAAKWEPLCVEDVLALEAQSGTRLMSTKTLADVVEAVIWAAYLDGGLAKALDCIRLFVPEIGWLDLAACHGTLAAQIPPPPPPPEEAAVQRPALPADLALLEGLVGHSFRNKAFLLTAVTHGSFSSSDGATGAGCMERLEFLGDALLDQVVVAELWPHDLSEQAMHLLRTACVNADLLGFLAQAWWATEPAEPAGGDGGDGDGVPVPVGATVRRPFWAFMRFHSPMVAEVQRGAAARYAQQADAVRAALDAAPTYPWALLARLGCPKFFSDMFESVLGAVWLDTGDLAACRDVVERFGILRHLRRFLRDKVDLLHPKNKLGELVGHRKVRYDTWQDPARETNDYVCQVCVDDKLVAMIENGIKTEEAKTKAADAACQLLEKHGLAYLDSCVTVTGNNEDEEEDLVMDDV